MKLLDDYLLDDNDKIKKDFLGSAEEISEDQARIVEYLKSGAGYASASSDWTCEFCKQEEPRSYMIDGVWMWPKWLIHYVEEHQVKLPSKFMKHMKRLKYNCPQLSYRQIDALASGRVDEILI